MMTTIRTTCPICGEVDLDGYGTVVLTVEAGGDEGIYRFDCPKCFDEVEKRADRRIIMLLTAVEEVLVVQPDKVDWDDAFNDELSCDTTHRWDFPVDMGQQCLCGKKRWGE